MSAQSQPCGMGPSDLDAGLGAEPSALERIALAIQAADDLGSEAEGCANGLSEDVSDWGAFLAKAAISALPAGGLAESLILRDALEALTTACEWFGQREAGEPATNREAAIFQRLSNVAANIEGRLGLKPSAQDTSHASDKVPGRTS